MLKQKPCWERKDFILPASRVDVGKEKGMHVELPTQIPWTGRAWGAAIHGVTKSQT